MTVQLHIPTKLPQENVPDTHRKRGFLATSDAIKALEEKNLLSLPRIEPNILERQALSLVTIRNELYRFIGKNTYLLTPWSRVLLEKLTGSQLVKKFPAFYGT